MDAEEQHTPQDADGGEVLDKRSGADDGDPGNRRWSGTGGKYTSRLVSGK